MARGSIASSFHKSLIVFIGGGIGAGMFGLPAVFAQSGIIWGSLIYWLIVVIALVIHLSYAELQLKDGKKHDLASVAEQSFGRPGWILASILYPLSIYGVVLVYLLLGAQFLSALSATLGGPTWMFGWQLVLWALFAWGAHAGIKGVTSFERPTSLVLLFGLLLATLCAAASGSGFHLTLLPQGISWSTCIGVFFFTALALPTIAEVVSCDLKKPASTRRAVIVGTLLTGALKWLFALAFAGVTTGTSLQVTELMSALPRAVAWLLPLIGFVAISGSAVSCLDSLCAFYQQEFAARRSYAWIAAVVPPLALLYVSHQALLPLMAFLGSFVSGTSALIICLAAIAQRIRPLGRLPRSALYIAIGLCVFVIAHKLMV